MKTKEGSDHFFYPSSFFVHCLLEGHSMKGLYGQSVSNNTPFPWPVRSLQNFLLHKSNPSKPIKVGCSPIVLAREYTFKLYMKNMQCTLLKTAIINIIIFFLNQYLRSLSNLMVLLYPDQDKTRSIWSNIAPRLQGLPKEKDYFLLYFPN